jgi:hypothetical protein
VFLIAFVVMVVLGQLNTLFQDAAGSAQFDDDGLTETLDFDTYAEWRGLKKFIYATVGEVVIWNIITYLHMYHYMPSWDAEDAGLLSGGGEEKTAGEEKGGEGKEESKTPEELEGTPLLT